MDTDESKDPAERLYAEGKRFDWKQDQSPAAASLARASFQQAAEMGHKGAVRALAHLVYDGRGGAADKERGLLLLWSAFRRGDDDALEEFADLLATYADEEKERVSSHEASGLAQDLGRMKLTLSQTDRLMSQLATRRVQRGS